MRSDKWYRARLKRYFDEHYGEFEDDIEWCVDPSPNKWRFKFNISCGSSIKIQLTCDDNGNITESHLDITRDVNKLYEIVDKFCHGFDAVYSDYIIQLVGDRGFDILKENNLLETCGVISGRQLCTLVHK